MRKIPAAELLDWASEPGAFMTRLIIDGYFLPKSPLEIFEAGEQSKVPLLAGWTSTEAPYLAFTGKSYPSPDNYERLVREQFGTGADEVLKLYPGKTESEVLKSATGLASDNFIVYSTWKWLDLQRKNSGQPVYVYIFSKARPPMKAAYSNVETGLKHSLTNERRWYVDIFITFSDGSLTVDIKNSLADKLLKNNSTGLGLANTRQRLALLYPTRYKLRCLEIAHDYHTFLTLNLKSSAYE